MKIEYTGVSNINGPLLTLDGVRGVAYDEMAEITMKNGQKRSGRVIMIDGEKVVLQVFEGTKGIALDNNSVSFEGHPMELALSKEMLGRVFNGAGRPIDGLGELYPEEKRDVNGMAMNPVARQYPRNCIYTGISAIDCMATLIRGQKLPIFSGAGMSHNQLAAQIVRQAKVGESDEKFGIVFAGMGLKKDAADFFKKDFEDSSALQRVVMFINEASDPIIERILTPRCALTAAEYLAFTYGMHILVIMTDMTAYCEALREFSSSKNEIPSRKGYPSYLYSDLASLYERAGMLEGVPGSVTQVPILTMPNDDITHPVPDLTGYITEGQIVLDRGLDNQGIFPPVSVLPSLSRLMKDGIGAEYTREDHSAVSNQLFACYAQVQDARSLASVIGEEELSDTDKKILVFGREFDKRFLNQGEDGGRTIDETLDLAWELLSILPRQALDRIDNKLVDQYYRPEVFEAFNKENG